MVSKFSLPYYAVIFTSTLNEVDEEYQGLDEILMNEAQKIGGFLGMDSARSGLGISVSYWESLDAIHQWRQHTGHITAINKGIDKWYESYHVRICKVEREYDFQR